MSVYITEGLSLFVSNTAFLEHLAVENTILCMIMLDFNVAVLSESFEFIFCLHGLFTTSTSLNEAEYVVGSIVNHQSTTNCIIFS